MNSVRDKLKKSRTWQHSVRCNMSLTGEKPSLSKLMSSIATVQDIGKTNEIDQLRNYRYTTNLAAMIQLLLVSPTTHTTIKPPRHMTTCHMTIYVT